MPEEPLNYTVTMINHGTAQAHSATVEDLQPTELESRAWYCLAAVGVDSLGVKIPDTSFLGPNHLGPAAKKL